MTIKFQSIKRFASKTEGMNFTEVFEDSYCKQVDVTTNKFTVRITSYLGLNILGVAVFTNTGEFVLKCTVDSQKDAIQYIENHVDRIVDEYIKENAVVSSDETAEEILYAALCSFQKFEITAEECLTVIYKALDKAQNKEERENIKSYAVMFSDRIENGQYSEKSQTKEVAEEPAANVSAETSEVTVTTAAYNVANVSTETSDKQNVTNQNAAEPVKQIGECIKKNNIIFLNKL